MNTARNLDSFNSTSPLFRDLSDGQAAQVSGGFVWETNLSGQEAQGLLGDSYNEQDNYSLVVFDTNDDQRVSFGDDYFIEGFSDIYSAEGSITLNSQQASQLGFGDGSNPGLSVTLDLGIDGQVGYYSAVSPARASRSSGRR